jgi:hypothetical protein
MPKSETPAERYRRLAEECMTAAAGLPPGEQRDTLIQMAQVWQRLAEQNDRGTSPYSLSAAATEQPVMQQQQQVQPDDDKKE